MRSGDSVSWLVERLLALLTIACATAATAFAQPFSFDDVEFWVGEGTNRAAVVIDWVENDSSQPALAWGYRWDGMATGRDMLTAVVTADDRLFAKFGGAAGVPTAVYGLGCDANDDGEFGISDGSVFDEAGITFGAAPFFSATATDPEDDYAEGWTFAFWHYGIAAANPFDGGSWASSSTGMAGRTLADGAWDSWAYTPSFDFAAFAENPVAAPGPILSLPGDYNGDGVVDADDYVLWKNAFGTTGVHAADGNGDGIVDAADYTVWRDHLTAAPAPQASGAHAVPEPATQISAALAALLMLGEFARRRCRRR